MKIHVHERSSDLQRAYIKKYVSNFDALKMLSPFHRRLRGKNFLLYSDNNFEWVGKYFLTSKSQHDNESVIYIYKQFAKEVFEQFDFLISNGVRFEYGDDMLFNSVPNYEKLMQFYDYEGYLPVKKTRQDDFHPVLSTITYRYSADDAMILKENEVSSNKLYQIIDANDLFRAVHDVFGHFASGGNFSLRGGRVAYAKHYPLFSDVAVRALATETMGTLSAWKLQGKKFPPNKAIDMPLRFHSCGLYIPY